MFRRYVLPWIVLLFYRLWTATWRTVFLEPPTLQKALANGDPIIFAHWHGDELSIIHTVPLYRIATMTSTSKDGELMDFVLRKLGGATSRGSTTRGGIGALKGLIRHVKAGYRASMAVDGPKGPLHQVKPGVFELSRLTGAWIVPTAAICARSKVFEKSWNKAQLPLPFTKVVIAFNEPMSAIDKSIDLRSSNLATELASKIFDARQQALKKLDDI